MRTDDDEVTRAVSQLSSAGYSVTSDVHGDAFDNRVITLQRGPFKVQVERERGRV
ncbi:MAG: hypothetical protein H0V73_05000, partial [Chloroflexi bacterium]|nr:hypothetical protein [Chloroflexota bacterium]